MHKLNKLLLFSFQRFLSCRSSSADVNMLRLLTYYEPFLLDKRCE